MEELVNPLDAATLELKSLIAAGDLETARAQLNTYHPADIADILAGLPGEQAVVAFRLLPDYEASEVLDETHSLLRAELVEQVDDERLADLLENLPTDDAVEFLEDLPDETAARLLDLMEPAEALEVRELLRYEEETAGRLMVRAVAALRRQWTVAQAFDYLRSLAEPEVLHYLYVVDVVGRLIGVVPVRNLILAQPDTRIEALMREDVISAPVDSDQEELAELMAKYDFTAMPVVDQDHRLVGVVTVDDVLDVIEEETTEDIQRLGGSEPLEQPYFTVSIPRMVRKRFVWLLLLFVASTLSGSVVNLFRDLTSLFDALLIFVPLIIGTGGNAGSQTVATIIRAIATDEVRLDDLGKAWRREVLTGLLLGVGLGVVGLVQARYLWGESWLLAGVVALSLPVVVMWANTTATVVPIVAEKLGIDPTVVSAPMITTIVDATGLLIYFTIASQLLLR